MTPKRCYKEIDANAMNEVFWTEKYERQYKEMLCDSKQRRARKLRLRRGIRVTFVICLGLLLSFLIRRSDPDTLSTLVCVILFFSYTVQAEELKRIFVFEASDSKQV